jgi:hypothetical protein
MAIRYLEPFRRNKYKNFRRYSKRLQQLIYVVRQVFVICTKRGGWHDVNFCFEWKDSIASYRVIKFSFTAVKRFTIESRESDTKS